MTQNSPYVVNVGAMKVRDEQSSGQTDRQATNGVAVVYYVRLTNGLIKIGTSRRPLERLERHRRNLGVDEVLAIEFGSHSLESQRHRQFADDLAEGREKFHASPALLAHIDALRTALNLTA